MINRKLPLLYLQSIFIFFISLQFANAQNNTSSLYKVLTLSGEKQGSRDLMLDHGTTGIWEKLLKLQTTASALHTQAHPDDEHADLLTYLSRGKGVRTALLCLNRGESGGNILGVETFDALGLLRTEEFLLAGSYYGLDDLYFTKLVDYGFSKRVDEAYDKWGKQKVIEEMVRVIRINRPLVIISRFHGSERDGHGNHQAAGEITQVAFDLAGDPKAFPEQISKEGLKPWKPLKLYRGGVKANERWNMQLNTGQYSPVLGSTYKNFSLLGYSYHRSQNGGHRNEVFGPSYQYYERLKSTVKSEEKENSFFDGIDTSITGIFKLYNEPAPPGVEVLLQQIGQNVQNASTAFKVNHPEDILLFLTDGLAKTRAAVQLAAQQPGALFMLQVKEQQFMDAINAVTGVHLQAMAVPTGTNQKRSFYEPQPVMGFAVAGQPFVVEAMFMNNSLNTIEPIALKLVAPADWKIETAGSDLKPLAMNDKVEQLFSVTVADGTPFSQPNFNRANIQESIYKIDAGANENLPVSKAPLQVMASYKVNGQEVYLQMPVQSRQANLPYGYDEYTLRVAPAIGVTLKPAVGIIPISNTQKTIHVSIELVNNVDKPVKGTLNLTIPAGWKVSPVDAPFTFTKAGEKSNFTMQITIPAIDQNTYNIQAVATANGQQYTQGYDLISHRDNDQALLYRNATATLKGIPVKIVPGLRVGYIMGVGDEVPQGIEQLGARVQLLNSNDLSTGRLDQFDVIMVGTRAYAVREDLRTYNQRLLDYAKNGGNMIVLFQTPEFVPERMAALTATLPGNSEEISEEDSPIKLLNEAHRVLNYPNKITLADFDNWMEQRGSKFFSKWDAAYVPIISTHDKGQEEQQGGWLMAKYGKGNYTYCAYAFHRQLPNGITGAYRIMANLLSYGKAPVAAKRKI